MNCEDFLMTLPHPVLQLDKSGSIRHSNQAWQRFVAQRNLCETNFFAMTGLVSEHLFEDRSKQIKDLVNEIKLLNNDFQMTLSPNEEGFNVLLVDISSVKDRQRQAIELASTDTLTGLPNRRAFLKEFKQFVSTTASQSGHSLVLIDLNRFKWINDTYGHNVGDKLLQHFASRLKSVLRKDSLLCRWGGDEFVAFLPNTSAKETQDIKRRCQKALKAPFKINSLTLRLSASIGSSSFQGAKESFEEVLEQADHAMYENKSLYYRSESQAPMYV